MTMTRDRAELAKAGVLVDWDVLDPTDYWERAEQLRALCPVAWTEAHGGAWVLSSFEDVFAAARDWQRFSTKYGSGSVQIDTDFFGMSFLHSDPPLHPAIRGMISSFFASDTVKTTDAAARAIVVEFLERALESDHCDFVHEVSDPVPGHIVFRVYLQREPDEVAWVLEILHRLAAEPEHAADILPPYISWCQSILSEMRDKGRHDGLLGTIAHAGLDGEYRLDEKQRTEMMMLIVAAGLDTTTGAMSTIAHYLATSPETRARLKGMGEAELDRVVGEFLRYEGPVLASGRTAMEDVVIGGCPIAKGERIILSWASANRDTSFFSSADQLILERANSGRHLAFGAGIHRCLGRYLAVQELRLLIEELCKLSKFELEPGVDLTFTSGMVRGFTQLPVIWQK
jgi:cytochrome P450